MSWKIKFLQNAKAFVQDHSPDSYSLLLAAPIGLFLVGYFIWAVFLNSFGIIENEFFRGKYIYTGFWFTVITTFYIAIIYGLLQLIGIIGKHPNIVRAFTPSQLTVAQIIRLTVVSFLWILIYAILIFPTLPTLLGGGQPRSLAIIGDPAGLPILTSFGIVLPQGSTYQTELLCIFGEDSRSVYMFRSDRVLSVDRTLIKGYVSLPGPAAHDHRAFCDQLARVWVAQGSVLEFQVSLAEKFNTLLSVFGTSSAIQIQCSPKS